MSSNRNFCDQSNKEILQENMNKVYWEKIHEARRQLETKYEGYENHPRSHKDFKFHLQRFTQYNMNTNMLWKKYWQQKLKELQENDYKMQKLIIWEEVRKSFDDTEEQSVSVLSKTETPEITKNEEAGVRVEGESSNSQVQNELDETVKIIKANENNEQNQHETSSTESDQIIVREIEENLVKIWDQGKQRGSEEVKRDMHYLKCWLDALSSYEIDCLIELVENPMQSEILDAYFDLQQQTRQKQTSEDDENCL